jgi:hypothetical protein
VGKIGNPEARMAIQHVNRRGETYYLHEGRTKTGKSKYFFSRQREGMLAAAVPAGYEVNENPNAQVFLRKAVPRVVTDEEVNAVERGVRDLARLAYFLIDVKGPSIIVHLANENLDFLLELGAARFGSDPAELHRRVQKLLNYTPMMRFTLVDPEARRFAVDRWCFRGSIDDWFPLSAGGDLGTQVARYCPHLGKESFYELF